MASHIGDKLKIEADDGEYVGILRSIDSNNGRLSMDEVTCVESGKKLTGMFHFYSKEIHSVGVVQERKRSETVVTDEERGSTILASKLSPRHLRGLKDIDRNKLFLSRQVSSTRQTSQSEDTSPYVDSESPDHNDYMTGSQHQDANSLTSIPYTVIDSYNDQFTQAIDHIKTQNLIGMSCQGINIGRHGQLCWLSIATKSCTMLFDILTLGEVSFARGLGEIIKSDQIQKVIHDCRRLSDLLSHVYNINLVNVFDTQVANVMIYRTETGDLPCYTEPLARPLLLSLKLPTDLVQVSKVRESNKKSDESVWSFRPSSPEVLVAATKDVMHLLALRLVLLEAMLKDFVSGVDIYLSSLRDTQDVETLSNKMSDQHKLPPEFARLQTRPRSARSDPTQYNQSGFHENFIGISDPHVKYSHDGVWHQGDGIVRLQTQVKEGFLLHNEVGRSRSRRRSQSSGRSRAVSDNGQRDSLIEGGISETNNRHFKGSRNLSSRSADETNSRNGKDSQGPSPHRPVPLFTETPKSDALSLSDDGRSTKTQEVTLIASGNETRTCLPKLNERIHEKQQSMNSTAAGSEGFDCIPGIESELLQRPVNRSPRCPPDRPVNRSPRCPPDQPPPANDDHQLVGDSCTGRGRGWHSVMAALELVTSSGVPGGLQPSGVPGGLQPSGVPGGLQQKAPVESRLPRCAEMTDSDVTNNMNTASLNHFGPDKLDARGNITLGRGHLRAK